MSKPIYFVNHGVTTRHLFNTKKFDLLRDALNYIQQCTGNHAFNLIRWTEKSEKKLLEFVK